MEVAKSYLTQLEEAHANFAAEYQAALTEIQEITVAPAELFTASEALQRLQAAAERATAAGVTERQPEVIQAAQEQANRLHALCVELLQKQAVAEQAVRMAASSAREGGHTFVPELEKSLHAAKEVRALLMGFTNDVTMTLQ